MSDRINDPPDGVLPFRENNPAPKKDLRREAELFIGSQPKVYALFERFALQMLERGRSFGISLLTERVRWEVVMTWDPDDRGFKINNNHRAYIARRLIQDHPRLEALVQCRKTFW